MPVKKSFGQIIIESKIWGPLGIIICSLIAVSIIVWDCWKLIVGTGIAPGSDVTSFAHTAKVMVDYYLRYSHFPSVDLGWYGGFEHQTAPPLIYIYLGVIYFFTHNIEITTRIFHIVGVLLVFFSMFYVMKKEKLPTLNSLIGSLAYTFMPQVYMSFHSYTKFIAVFLLPFMFYFTNQLLREPQKTYKYLPLLAFTTALVIYSHPMNGVVFGISIAIYAFLYAFFDKNIVSRRFYLVLASMIIGIVLTSSFIIPFMKLSPEGTFDKSGVWESSVVVNTSGTLDFKPVLRILGGWLVLLIAPLYVFWRTRNPMSIALYVAGIITLIITFGYVFLPLAEIFPFKLTYAYVWVYFITFALAYIYGLIIPYSPLKNLISFFGRLGLGLIIIVIFYILMKTPSQIGNIYPRQMNPGDITFAQYLKTYSNKGRLWFTHFPLGDLTWPLSLYSGKEQVEGHYFGLSRVGKQIALMNDATHNEYPDYVLKKLQLLNVNYFITNKIFMDMEHPIKKTKVGELVIDKLEKNGYQKVYEQYVNPEIVDSDSEADKYRLYYKDTQLGYVQPINQKYLVIGKYGPTLAAAASEAKINMLEGGDKYLDDYDLDYLLNFETVFLYGFSYHDKVKAEQIAKDYVKNGGKLVIEFAGIENSKLAENPVFLGVSGIPKKITETTKVQKSPVAKDLLPDNFEIPGEIFDDSSQRGKLAWIPMKEWNAYEYYNLDESLASLQSDDNLYSILGYKNVEGGKVIFVGLNIFYHLYNTHNINELQLVRRLATNLISHPKIETNKEEIFTANEEIRDSNFWRYNINSSINRLILISLAYSPNWRAYIDGKEVKIYHTEGLMSIKYPAGNHELELKYNTAAPNRVLGVIISIFTACVMVSLLIFHLIFNRNKKITRKD